MEINISAIREQRGGQLPVEGTSPAPPLEVAGGAVACGPVRVTGSVTNVGKGFLVRARLRCECELVCTRCLVPFRRVLEPDLQEMFYPERLRGSKPEGEDVANWFSGDVLDLAGPIRENLQLALPMKLLCREDCRGLCPRCGRNLNEGPCGCTEDRRDPRWAPLGALLRDGGPGRPSENGHGRESGHVANPKRRFSRARTRTRRSHWRLAVPNLSPCPRCHKLRLSHRVCPHCGTYRGRQYLKPAEEQA